MSFIKEFLQFIVERKKYWLIPIFVFLVLFGSLIVLGKGSALYPFVYTLF